jgi:SNF2-related domain/SNF2 Helicase protein/Helicase conserved C-terminal domain
LKVEGAHLLFLPDVAQPRLFLWGAQANALSFASLGRTATERCITETGAAENIEGLAIALRDALPALAAIGVAEASQLPASISIWSAATKFALDLIARGRLIPTIEQINSHSEARWRASIALGDDADRFARLANSFPPAAHAIPASTERRGKRARRKAQEVAAPVHMWTPDALLERFLNACVDVLMRSAEQSRPDPRASWEQRWVRALHESDATFGGEGFAERLLTEDLKTWIKPLAGVQGEARACFRLDLPEINDADASGSIPPQFTLRYFLQSARDASLLMPAADVYRGGASIRRGIASSARSAQEHLLGGLAVAGRLFPPIELSLHEARPESISMKSHVAWEFLNTAAPQLIEAGLGVILPSELTRTGQRRLRMRMRVGSSRGSSESGSDVLSLNSMLTFRWQAELAGEALDIDELRELAKLRAPLVRHRGRWVAVDSREINEAIRLLEERGGTLAAHEGLAAAFGAAERSAQTSLPIEVAVEGSFADLLTRLRAAPDASEFTVPESFVGTLRPYQVRGAGWLATMSDLGLGACLADDMGLGKTVQLIALLLHRQRSGMTAPVLLVCPTSVVGNWERELQRFAPAIPFVRHYGSQRARDAESFTKLEPGTVVFTTYGLLRRDWRVLSEVDWSIAALDEAQNIKNSASRTAQTARALKADFRVALTGTPVENRLTELWSIFEFLNPRFLGPQAEFRRTYAIPIERYGQAEVAEQLKRLTQPFILRRLKSDPTIIQDLPDKQEMKVICSLTREQASLYQAVLDEALDKIENAEGIERRGQVLALLTALKQICNHPAQYLGEPGPLQGRSGKLQRAVEMLEEVLDGGDRALVFTQYREMGDRLVNEFKRVFGLDVPFLHGGVPQAARDEMVRRFQEDARSPPIFVLSVKAGGTGLNLTAANHVFHYDRWWNPAVEDQATDRAYRIGQQRSVQVHKLMCAGTVEDKIDQLLESKRQLAATIVGAGEQWITELDDTELRDLFALAPDAVISEDIGEAEPAEAPASDLAPKKKRTRRREEAST